MNFARFVYIINLMKLHYLMWSLNGGGAEFTMKNYNGDIYISDNRRQTCRDDGIEQGTILKNGKPLIGVKGWNKRHFVDSLYRHLNGIEQWKDPSGL